MKFPLRIAILATALTLPLALPAYAQYMYLDSNGNGIHDAGDAMQSNGTGTTVAVWLDTAHNRDGTASICDTADGNMTINSYVVNMASSGGNVTYSGFVNDQTTFTVAFGEVNTGNNLYKNGFGQQTAQAPGLYKLMHITVTGTSGSPALNIVPIITGSPDATSFGSQCSGHDFDNTLKLGGDWFDEDGLTAGTVTNNPPVITSPGNKTVNELTNLAFTVTATDPDAGQTVTFTQTLGSPAATGATTSAAGAFSWTPTEAQGPGVYPITFTATDNGTSPASASTSITITVNEVNQAPSITNPGNKTVNELSTLAFTLTATDADVPAQPLTFSQTLGSPAATGATTAANGAFSWNPTEAQGPGVYPITFNVSDGTATNSTSITITVNEVNQAPVLNAIGNKSGTVGNPITFTATATDADLPAQTLAFSLTLGSPAATGATINASSGAFSWTPSASGSFPVTITVTDNGTPPLSASEGITITVGAGVNNPPVLAAIGNKTVNELVGLIFSATATDPDAGQTLAFSLTLGSPAATGAIINPQTGGFVWTPTEAQGPGVYPVTITVTDNGSPPQSDFEAITITVNEVNQAPVITNPGNKTVNELANLAFTVTATDADLPANTLTFTQALGSPAATGATTSAAGAFSWTPTEAQGPGVYPITFNVSDGTATASTSITITVNEVNVAPVLNAIGNRSGTVGNAITFTATATDADIPANTLAFSLDAGAPAGATINGSSGAFSWTPSASGTFPVTVRVTDNGTPPLSDFEGITITVAPAGDNPPVLTSPGNKTVDELVNLSFTLSATDPDAGATLTFSQTLGSPAATGATTSAAGAFSWTPTEAQGPGVYPITFIVSDGTLTDQQSIAITVNEVNQNPVLTNPGNKTVDELTNLAFTLTATDADLPAQPLTFSQTLGSPAATGATTSAAGAFNWTPTEAQGPGVYPVTFSVSDGAGGSANTSISITVNEVNVAPVLAPIGNKSGSVGVAITFTATATDADIPSNTLTFSLDAGAPAGATIDPSTGAFSWTPSASGLFTVTVRVTDNGTPQLDDSEAITISVGNVNHAPVLDQPQDMIVDEGSTADQQLTATDPDGDALTFSNDTGSPLFMTVSASGNVHLAPGFSDAGTYTGHVSVSDGSLSDSKSFGITVNNVNRGPTADAGGPYTGTIGNDIHFDGSGSSDPDGDVLSYAWDFGDGNSGTGVAPLHPYSSAGDFTVTLTVTDTGGLSNTATTTAHVVSSFPATVFTTGGNGSIKLNSGKPQSCVQIEPTDGDFDIANVDLSSVVMQFGAGQISALAGKTQSDGDKNHDGVSEITACFSKDDLRTLFAGQPTGDYSVTITGNLLTGGSFTGNVTLHVVNNGNFAASISPNPLNPKAVLTFSTSKLGSVKVGLYDVQGRLIRTLMEESAAQAGYHDVTIDGRDNQGNHLASGVYYVMIQSEVDGKLTKAITILK